MTLVRAWLWPRDSQLASSDARSNALLTNHGSANDAPFTRSLSHSAPEHLRDGTGRTARVDRPPHVALRVRIVRNTPAALWNLRNVRGTTV